MKLYVIKTNIKIPNSKTKDTIRRGYFYFKNEFTVYLYFKIIFFYLILNLKNKSFFVKILTFCLY